MSDDAFSLALDAELPRSGSACTSGGRSLEGERDRRSETALREAQSGARAPRTAGDLTHVLRSSGSFELGGQTLTLMAANRCNRPLQRMSTQSERLAVTLP